MLKSFKFGNAVSKRKASRLAAILLTLAGGLAPAKLHADDRHTATARLEIQITVMPTLIAATPSLRSSVQPSQAPISFNLNADTQNSESSSASYSTQQVTVTDHNGTHERAELKTLTLVSD